MCANCYSNQRIQIPFATILLHISIDGVRLIATPNIGVYQQAHYQCSVNNAAVGITWFVNETLSTNNTIVQLGIVTNGAGSPNSSLTIPGYPQYNNTIVRCFAAGFVDGSHYTNFSDSILRIQGNLIFTSVVILLLS